MKVRVELGAEFVERAKQVTGVASLEELVHRGLQCLVERESARKLSAMGGSDPALKPVRRRRSAR
ncbi:MAG: type II toxin-antitoxin system VapB family antitoxin [Armatimonadetes bacterium]|nr:type II toxin-antitoxin system VapB family antitoxin [Armatimonadota bacterium]